MGKRRTKEDVAFNETLLDKLWDANYTSGDSCIITYMDLKNGEYRGSLPYTVPSSVGSKYLIRQRKQRRGNSTLEKTYSILKMTK